MKVSNSDTHIKTENPLLSYNCAHVYYWYYTGYTVTIGIGIFMNEQLATSFVFV